MTFERSIPFAEQYPSRIAVSSVVASQRISGTANPTKKARRMPEGRAGAKYGGRHRAGHSNSRSGSREDHHCFPCDAASAARSSCSNRIRRANTARDDAALHAQPDDRRANPPDSGDADSDAVISIGGNIRRIRSAISSAISSRDISGCFLLCFRCFNRRKDIRTQQAQIHQAGMRNSGRSPLRNGRKPNVTQPCNLSSPTKCINDFCRFHDSPMNTFRKC